MRCNMFLVIIMLLVGTLMITPALGQQTVINVDFNGEGSEVTHNGADGVLSTPGGGTFWNGVRFDTNASNLLDENNVSTSVGVEFIGFTSAGSDSAATNDLQDSGTMGGFRIVGLLPSETYTLAVYAGGFAGFGFNGGWVDCTTSLPTYVLPGTVKQDYCRFDGLQPSAAGSFEINPLDGLITGFQLLGKVTQGGPAPTCQADNDCQAGEICLEGTCVLGCRTNVDCGGGQVCSPELTCVDAPRLPSEPELALEISADPDFRQDVPTTIEIGFNVMTDTLQIYGATMFLGDAFTLNLPSAGTSAGDVTLEVSSLTLTFPVLVDVAGQTLCVDVDNSGQCDSGEPTIVIAEGSIILHITLPFGGDNDPSTLAHPVDARLTLMLSEGVLTPTTAGSYAVRGIFTSVDPDTGGGDDGAGLPPRVLLVDRTVEILPVITDGDGDGVSDDLDQCPGSDLRPTVVIDGCDSGVANTLSPTGCTISDLIAACAVGAQDHGEFVSCVAHLTNDLVQAGTLTGQQEGAIQSCAAQADLP